MTTAIIIPFRDRGVDPLRFLNLKRVLEHWDGFGVDVHVVSDGRAGSAQFNRSAANNRGAAFTDADVLVYTESDILVDYQQIREAITLAGDELGMVVPFTHQKKLTSTDSVLVRSHLKEAVDCVPDHHPYGETTNYGCVNVISRATLAAVGQWDETFCVDEETEILTNQGWRHYPDVSVGGLVLTLNHTTGLSEWQPVDAINIFAGTHEMLSIESTTHSSLTTLNHRWPVIREENKRVVSGVTHYEWRAWKTTEKFTTADHVPTAADCADLPTEPKYNDALVEAVAWFWTEGGIHRLRNRLGRSVSITQSYEVNPDNCDRIASVLTRALGPSSAFLRRNRPVKRVCTVCGTEFEAGSAAAKYCSDACRPDEKSRIRAALRADKQRPSDIPRWKTYRTKKNVVFVLNAEAGDIVQALAPGRVPSYEFLLSLTHAQLLLFIEASMLGDGAARTRWYEPDGHRRVRSREEVLGQKDPKAAEAFQFACVLAGYATSISTNPVMPRYGYGMTTVRLKQQRRTKAANGVHHRVVLEGNVWCPTTKNATWLARRHGKVYFTGNSGHGHDDSAMWLAFNKAAGQMRWVDGSAYHLYHLGFDPELEPDASHITQEDRVAQGRNYQRMVLYCYAKTPGEIRQLTGGAKGLNTSWRSRWTGAS
jgi:hypothetical protein